MGYRASQTDANIFVSFEHMNQMLDATQEYENMYPRFSGKPSQFTTIQQAMDYYFWSVDIDEVDGEKCIIEIHFTGEKIRSEKKFLKVIAPYVDPGSYIEMCGEDGCMWRWTFNDNTCYELSPEIIWPERP